MKEIRIIGVSKPREIFFRDAEEFYAGRLERFVRVNRVYVKESGEGKMTKVEKLREESKGIAKYFDDRHYRVCCDKSGKSLSSEEFSGFMKTLIEGPAPAVDFIIGGSDGLDDGILRDSRHVISFSRFTFPHELFRVILMEQIYRAFMIMKGTPYHK